MTKPFIKYGSVQKYNNTQVISHWLIIIIVLMLFLTGGIPFFNWFMIEMHIYGISITEIPNSLQVHYIFGYIFIFFIIYYITNHLKDYKNIVSENPVGDVKSFYNSLYYTLGITRRKELSEGDLYLRSQKVLFILYIYTIGLIIFSGLLLFFDSMVSDASSLQSFDNGIFITHILSVTMFLFLVIFQIGSILRDLDRVALKSILFHGRVPLWYMKKNHSLWYQKIMENHKKQKSE